MRTLFGDDERLQFEQALRSRGLIPPKVIIGDGEFHRCNTTGRNGKSDGSYVVFGDGTVPAGGFNNFQDGDGFQPWRYKPRGRDLTPSEDAQASKKAEDARERHDAAVLEGQRRAAEKAQRLWDAAEAATSHPY